MIRLISLILGDYILRPFICTIWPVLKIQIKKLAANVIAYMLQILLAVRKCVTIVFQRNYLQKLYVNVCVKVPVTVAGLVKLFVGV